MCHALSKALPMSMQIYLASCFSAMALCSCIMYVKASPVEWLALNPNSLSETRLCLHTYYQMAEYNSFSITLLIMLRSIVVRVVLFTLFVAGITWATFHCLGMIPLLKHSWNYLANGFAISGTACFKTQAGVEFGPFSLSMHL